VHTCAWGRFEGGGTPNLFFRVSCRGKNPNIFAQISPKKMGGGGGGAVSDLFFGKGDFSERET
jgi:hypothetical protein